MIPQQGVIPYSPRASELLSVSVAVWLTHLPTCLSDDKNTVRDASFSWAKVENGKSVSKLEPRLRRVEKKPGV